MAEKKGAEDRRKARVRRAIRKAANGRPRLSVFRSSKQIYAQVIDDERGVTVASASTIERDLKGKLKTGADKAAVYPRSWLAKRPRGSLAGAPGSRGCLGGGRVIGSSSPLSLPRLLKTVRFADDESTVRYGLTMSVESCRGWPGSGFHGNSGFASRWR